jgi:hypothetical protein
MFVVSVIVKDVEEDPCLVEESQDKYLIVASVQRLEVPTYLGST